MYKYEEMIRLELSQHPETRDNDRLLTMRIWQDFYGINPWSPVSEVMQNEKLPSPESLGRVRRKIQERDESLRGTRKRESERMEQQKRVLDYVAL